MTSPLGLAAFTAGASCGSGLWRLAITPLDTCKTVLQVEGIPGFKTVVAKVCGFNLRALAWPHGLERLGKLWLWEDSLQLKAGRWACCATSTCDVLLLPPRRSWSSHMLVYCHAVYCHPMARVVS